MIAISHILFGAIICFALFFTLRVRGIHSPPKLFYPLTLFMMEFPDVDHLYWMRIKSRQVVPFTIWDLFKWTPRIEDNPANFLHYWIYPFVLLALLSVSSERLRTARWIILGAFMGWTVHLILDGVIHFI